MSKLFPYANVHEESIKGVIWVAPEFAGTTTTPPKGLGFSLIRDTLVSNSFRDEVTDELQHARLNCYEVTRVADLFEQTYLDSLTMAEMDVLGEVVMLLIEKGVVPISLVSAEAAYLNKVHGNQDSTPRLES